MLRRLEAEETLAGIGALLFAGGRTMPDDQRRKYQRELDETVDPERVKPIRPSPDQLRAMGVNVRVLDEQGEEVTSE